LIEALAQPEGVHTREIFETLSLPDKLAFYALATSAIAIFSFGAFQRFRKYRRGRPAGRLRMPFTRTVRRSVAIGSNSTVAKRDPLAGLAHFAIFWGFLVLFAGTVILTIDYDIVRPVFGEEASFYRGAFYRIYSLTLDMFGVAFLVGLGFMSYRRWFMKLPQLDYHRAERPPEGYTRAQFWDGDWLFLGLLGMIAVTGFVVEALRIHMNGFPDFEVWSPVGWVMASGLSSVGLARETTETYHYAFWWSHSLAALGFVAYLPYSKAMHMIVDIANLLFHDRNSARNLPRMTPESDHVGYRDLEDFTWKELLDLDACTKCGRCHVACPAKVAGAPLSPRDVILDLRQWVDEQSRIPAVLDREERPVPTGPLSAQRNGNGAMAAGEVVSADALWACTTCMACVEACPVGIEHVSTIVQMRRSLVDRGEMEQSVVDVLSNVAQQGNSFGKSARMRARWTKKLDFPVPDARKEPVTYLWFVGDFASFDERLQELSRKLARILHDAGVSFGLLYEGEWNSGNDVRRVGEEGLFELLVEKNMESFAQAQFQEIFTTDPHSFNTLRNEYPEFGASYPVKHYTQLLEELISSGTLDVRPLGKRVTYHDPCYLGRYNRVTGAPRRVLEALSCELVEMPRNRENTFCCGAGGGRIWMDDSGVTERPSENRIKEAVELDIDYFVVSCPKDVTMYSDAVKTTGHDDRMSVVDIIELVDEALAAQPVVAGVGEGTGES
jgi:Fe-S oxidoreductase/nitrate reductase gamma subunit